MRSPGCLKRAHRFEERYEAAKAELIHAIEIGEPRSIIAVYAERAKVEFGKLTWAIDAYHEAVAEETGRGAMSEIMIAKTIHGYYEAPVAGKTVKMYDAETLVRLLIKDGWSTVIVRPGDSDIAEIVYRAHEEEPYRVREEG